MTIKKIRAGVLDVAYMEYGDMNGWPCVMNHGFPYDVHAYSQAAELLADSGARVLVPFLRGFGETRFLSSSTPRSGEQAALGADLLAFLDAHKIEKAVLGGYDWGGRAACIVSALWPERVTALVSGNSYNILNVAKSNEPASPKMEAAFWYQYFFHSERGRRGLQENRAGFTRHLWQLWSPKWSFDDEIFEQSRVAFDNPDFVEVSIHSYRHRYGLVPGDPAVAFIETALTGLPNIIVPVVCIDGDADTVSTDTSGHAAKFVGPYDYRVFAGAGHNLPQERPEEWAQAVLDARRMGER